MIADHLDNRLRHELLVSQRKDELVTVAVNKLFDLSAVSQGRLQSRQRSAAPPPPPSPPPHHRQDCGNAVGVCTKMATNGDQWRPMATDGGRWRTKPLKRIDSHSHSMSVRSNSLVCSQSD
jgi:hypothetical protein